MSKIQLIRRNRVVNVDARLAPLLERHGGYQRRDMQAQAPADLQPAQPDSQTLGAKRAAAQAKRQAAAAARAAEQTAVKQAPKKAAKKAGAKSAASTSASAKDASE